MQDELTDRLLSHEESPTPTVFTLPPLEFMHHFSSINDVYSPSVYLRPMASPAVHTETLKALAGNSRNPPTPFLFECERKSLNGCTYTYMAHTAMARHEASCKHQKETESKSLPRHEGITQSGAWSEDGAKYEKVLLNIQNEYFEEICSYCYED